MLDLNRMLDFQKIPRWSESYLTNDMMTRSDGFLFMGSHPKKCTCLGGVLFVVLLCQWHPAAPTPAITPFRLLSHATGWVGNWRTLFGCVPTCGSAFLFGATDKSKPRANENFKIKFWARMEDVQRLSQAQAWGRTTFLYLWAMLLQTNGLW